MISTSPPVAPPSVTDERAALGNPSFVWRFGQDRRLALVRQYVPLEGKRILDVGCGLGMYVRRFRQFSETVYGIDVAFDRVRKGADDLPNLMLAVAEHLPYPTGSFDVVFLNEVIEHVADDRATMVELSRVLRPGGIAVFYAPNRFYPFETHGIYLNKKYVFGNIPLVNYLPRRLRDKLVPHARVYQTRDFARLIQDLPLQTVVHRYVYPGFDNIAARNRGIGSVLRRILYAAEGSLFQIFGLSHLLILRKAGASADHGVAGSHLADRRARECGEGGDR